MRPAAVCVLRLAYASPEPFATGQDIKTIDLDLRGLKCPMPVLRTRKTLRALAPGDIVVVRSTDPLSPIDIPAAMAQDGHALLDQSREDDEFIFKIRRAG